MICGLTGSMAAGKSTAAKLLRKHGYSVIDADEIAHKVLELDSIKEKLAAYFGKAIFNEAGQVDHRALSYAAFESGHTAQLNAITHPIIREVLLEQAYKAEEETGSAVLDVPLLIESGLNRDCDFVLLITANIETRYRRIMQRDGLSRKQAQARLRNQMPQWKKKRFADRIISNDGDEAGMEEQLLEAMAIAESIAGREECGGRNEKNSSEAEKKGARK